MDLYVEKQCVDKMKGGDGKQFLSLLDANFVDVYMYVARRVGDRAEVEKIVRLTFLDALGQIGNTPTDVSYLIWLYSLAKPRVWDYIAKGSASGQSGLVTPFDLEKKENEEVVGRVDKMMKKLSLEEWEILRLKFFEEVADGDLIAVLGIEEGKVGKRIYQVLKRAHFLLFGEEEGRKKVYFGKLSGLFEKVRRLEEVEVPEVLKLSLKADFTNRIERKNFAIAGEVVEEKKPFKVKEKLVGKGSNDPAKIFVEAVKEMKEKEVEKRMRQQDELDRRERTYDFLDRWKGVFALIPLVLFVWIVIFVVLHFGDFIGGVERGYPNSCEIAVDFDGDFSDGVRRGVDVGITNRICDYFEVSEMQIVYVDERTVNVEVDVIDWFLEYEFVRKDNEWRIQKYARTPYSNQESGQV